MLCRGNIGNKKTWLAHVRKNTMVCRVGEDEVGALEDELGDRLARVL